ncbi:flavodoxin [Fructilactobacillus vespulae]|uniref:flavodoxin n=1 Tax=Fructilactobacillus vespulae TaxID=1249630 RepID=UPI0039B39B5C
MDKKTLIAYYSRTGNTKELANLIHTAVGGDLFQIETAVKRPTDYEMEVAKNQREQMENVLPQLKNSVTDFSTYDYIFVGFPTWNMALPQVMVTFLKEYDFHDKKVVPFNTNGGFGYGATLNQINQYTKGSSVLEPISFKGGLEKQGIPLTIKGIRKDKITKEINQWLVNIGVKK